MSKHIDLIAVGALLLSFGFAARVHEVVHLGTGRTQMFRIRAIKPVVVVPPHTPAVPCLPSLWHLPRV